MCPYSEVGLELTSYAAGPPRRRGRVAPAFGRAAEAPCKRPAPALGSVSLPSFPPAGPDASLPLWPGTHGLSCRNNPLIVPVLHDLSQQFYHTRAILITFGSPFLAISGVALRSFQNFDPITASSCQSGQTYSPAEQR